MFLIVGGEGLLHCFTAPVLRPHNQTDCPRCGKTDPETTVATLVNGIASAVKQIDAQAEVIVWAYGGFTWTKTPDARRLISLVSRDCAWMANFDTGECVEREGVSSVSPDYSLIAWDRGDNYLSQMDAAQQRGLKVLAKVESGSPRDEQRSHDSRDQPLGEEVPGYPGLSGCRRNVRLGVCRLHGKSFRGVGRLDVLAAGSA